MRLIEDLRRRVAGEANLFQAQLLREDITRIARLVEMARAAGDPDAFRTAGMRIGWTQGDSRTQELAEPLDALFEAIYAYCTGHGDAAQEARIDEAWRELYRVRMERLVGCLSNPIPKPAE